MGTQSSPDTTIARIAARQFGVATRAQLLAAGLSSKQIAGRVRGGRLHPVHRGIYAVGHRALATRGRWLAAVLACGEGALLARRSAGGLWRVIAWEGRAVDVTVVGRAMHTRPGIAISRPSVWLPEWSATHDGVPVTSLPKTMEDLRQILNDGDFGKAVMKAKVLHGYLTPAAPTISLSQAEQRYAALLRRSDLRPLPEQNVEVQGHLLDFWWPEHRLNIELDGPQHGTPLQMRKDRRRDAHLRANGVHVERFVHDEDPAVLLAETARLLSLTCPSSPRSRSRRAG